MKRGKHHLSTKLYLAVSALIILGLSGAVTAYAHSYMQRVPIKQYFPEHYTQAVWDWKGIARDHNQTERAAVYLRSRQINLVYMDASSVTDLDPRTQQTQFKKWQNNLHSYVETMRSRDIAVYVAGGATDWSKPEQRYRPQRLLAFVQNYNQTYPNDRVAGVEYDIESYNQAGFADSSDINKQFVLSQYLDMAAGLVTAQQSYLQAHSNDPLDIGFAIPYWYDNENKNIPPVSWNGKTGPVLYHLFDRLQTLPLANSVVMAYRNAARGNNGTIAIARTEIEYAQSKSSHVRVMIGQETTNVEPAKITFYGRSILEFANEQRMIYDEYGGTGVFGGVAINDLDGFLALGG